MGGWKRNKIFGTKFGETLIAYVFGIWFVPSLNLTYGINEPVSAKFLEQVGKGCSVVREAPAEVDY